MDELLHSKRYRQFIDVVDGLYEFIQQRNNLEFRMLIDINNDELNNLWPSSHKITMSEERSVMQKHLERLKEKYKKEGKIYEILPTNLKEDYLAELKRKLSELK